MLRWYPLVKAKSDLAGPPVVYDLMRLSYLTKILPNFQPITRDLENVRRRLLRKTFGVRVSLELAFEISHSRTLNTFARYYETESLNLLKSPFDLTVAPWSLTNATSAVSPSKDPPGTFTATRLTDADGANVGLLFQNTGISAANKVGLFSVFARADAPHVFSIGIQDAGAYSIDSDFNAEFAWKRVTIRRAFPFDAANFQAMIRATQLIGSQTGNVDLYWPDLRRIVELPGTDEEILADLKSKFCDDDWEISVSLDGGLNYRDVLLDGHEKTALEDKWVGHREVFNLTAREPLPKAPAFLDGMW